MKLKIMARQNLDRQEAFELTFVHLALAVFLLATASVAKADISTCANIGSKPWPNGDQSYSIHMDHVTYKGPFTSDSTDSRASKEGGVYKVRLRGWLYYKPDSSGIVKNSKVVIYNHGSEAGRGEPCALVRYFVDNGYVVFAPLRRGHFANPPDPEIPDWFEIHSTGIHTENYVTKCLRSQQQASNGDRPHLYRGSSYCRGDSLFLGTYEENAVEVDYVRRQHIDIRDQIDFMIRRGAIGTTGKLADPRRVAVLGHSFGGSAVIFANQYGYDNNVTVAVCAAEKSWGDHNPYWEIDLSQAMEDQSHPIYFLQPKNGRTLEPTKVLFGIAIDKAYRSQAAIFPPAPCKVTLGNGTCDETDEEDWEQFHSTFIGKEDQIKIWGPSARNFINRHPL